MGCIKARHYYYYLPIIPFMNLVLNAEIVSGWNIFLMKSLLTKNCLCFFSYIDLGEMFWGSSLFAQKCSLGCSNPVYKYDTISYSWKTLFSGYWTYTHPAPFVTFSLVAWRLAWAVGGSCLNPHPGAEPCSQNTPLLISLATRLEAILCSSSPPEAVSHI